ncbi:MAG: GntR family transcriptional regulator [Rubritepida sp.]|nr:GntR family transcriptional regulator [Rubritepida sp.]
MPSRNPPLEPNAAVPTGRRLKRQLSVEIAVIIRSGGYRTGEWLRQIDLEERLGANRFEVRTALAELALRGTVEHVPNRGFRVAEHDRKRLRDLLAVRALLEAEAAVAALPFVTRAVLAEFSSLAEAFDEAVEIGSPAEQSAANLAFHDALYAHAPNRPLAQLAIEMRDRARLWPVVLWPSAAALRRSAEGHRLILRALSAGDAALLAAEVRAHILGSAANDPELG